ncbi:PH domain-containing protein [Streptomyces sp. 11x1]|uniref:PH domain-containing protein n=1 Tax=Streptomyces sp. 11x1 TaxID=3038642 RepID=UPI0029309F8A|nr:PH domain-containing protein [Streptomyces sp. 11x1]WNZ09201.1 PH domain-containing protein [Streptomyces sp. 11x1]
MSNEIDREYRRRRGIHPALLVTMAAAAFIIALSVNSMMTLGPSSSGAMAVAAWLFVVTRAVLEQFRARTSVTAEGVTVRGAIRTRSWAWSEIYGIRVEDNRWGSPRWSGYLYATDGTRVRLLHVDEYQMTDPIAEIADLGATALRLGLTSMGTRPDVEERVARGARRRKAWQRAAIASAVVMAATFVVDFWLGFTDRPTHLYALVLGVPLACLPVLFYAFDRLGERRHRRGLTPPATRTATDAPHD